MTIEKVTKPIPSPNAGESQDEFMSRCMGAIGDEFDSNDQAVAVCMDAWRKQKDCPDCTRKDLNEQLQETLNDRIEASFDLEIKAMKPGEDADFEAVINTNIVDRDGEVCLPEGMDASEYKNSINWSHLYELPPIALNLGITRGKNRWVARGKWCSHELAQTIKSCVDDGIMFGASVGFRSIQSRVPTAEDKKLFGKEVNKVFSRWKLLEWSICTIASNPETLVHSLRKSLDSGKTTVDTIKKYFNLDINPEPIEIKAQEDKPVEAQVQPETIKKKVVIFYKAQPKIEEVEHVTKVLILKRQGKLYEENI